MREAKRKHKQKLSGEDERTKAMKEMFAVAESKQFAGKLTDVDEFLKEERRKSDREFGKENK